MLEGGVTFWRHFSWVGVVVVPNIGKCSLRSDGGQFASHNRPMNGNFECGGMNLIKITSLLIPSICELVLHKAVVGLGMNQHFPS